MDRMELEFNPNRMPLKGYSEPVGQRVVAKTGASTDAPSNTNDLSNTPANVPLVRADKVAQAKLNVADEHYPPNYILDRIATLLAIKLKDQ